MADDASIPFAGMRLLVGRDARGEVKRGGGPGLTPALALARISANGGQ